MFQFGSQNLGEALTAIAIALGVIAVVILIVWWIARRRGTPTVGIVGVHSLALMWAGLCGVGAVATIWRGIAGGDRWIDDVPANVTLNGDGSAVAASGTKLLSVSASSVDVWVDGLAPGTRAVIAAGDVLAVAMTAVPAVIIALICSAILRGRPFAAATVRALTWGAVAIGVGGVLTDILVTVGKTLVANDALPAMGDISSPGVFQLQVPLWPLATALALLALAAAFRYGARLQRDTEGLV